MGTMFAGGTFGGDTFAHQTFNRASVAVPPAPGRPEASGGGAGGDPRRYKAIPIGELTPAAKRRIEEEELLLLL